MEFQPAYEEKMHISKNNSIIKNIYPHTHYGLLPSGSKNIYPFLTLDYF